jgi:hypothetical protein
LMLRAMQVVPANRSKSEHGDGRDFCVLLPSIRLRGAAGPVWSLW